MIRKTSSWLVVGLLGASLLFAGCASQEQKTSITKTNEGVKALNSKQYDIAIGKLEEATKAYRDNHTAWYNLGLAYDAQKKWDDAAKSYEQAVKLSGSDAMYHMKHGISMYKAVLEEGKVRQAKLEEKDPGEIDANSLDLKGANFEPATQELEAAVKLNPDLFRAYYYIGRIRRHQDDAQKAAEAFTKAIEANPRENDPYVALGELYRRWDYTDDAVKVLAQGKANVRGLQERAELLFALGMAYNDKKEYTKAIPEFSEALEADKNLHRAKYMRGMAYYRTSDFKNAKTDLEAYQKASKDEFSKGVASKTLMDIMAKQM
jgi:tetratricopeptide (TPR) repeat protein